MSAPFRWFAILNFLFFPQAWRYLNFHFILFHFFFILLLTKFGKFTLPATTNQASNNNNNNREHNNGPTTTKKKCDSFFGTPPLRQSRINKATFNANWTIYANFIAKAFLYLFCCCFFSFSYRCCCCCCCSSCAATCGKVFCCPHPWGDECFMCLLLIYLPPPGQTLNQAIWKTLPWLWLGFFGARWGDFLGGFSPGHKLCDFMSLFCRQTMRASLGNCPTYRMNI